MLTAFLRKVTTLAAFSLVMLAPQDVCAQQGSGPQLAVPEVGKLPQLLQMHGSAVIGQRLYVFGGDGPAGWNRRTWSAPIAPDMKIGSWREEAQLPIFLAYSEPTVEVIGNRVYVCGGMVATDEHTSESKLTALKSALWNEAGADGMLGQWRTSSNLPAGTILGSSCTDGRYIYITGGNSGGTVGSHVLASQIGADGAPGEWKQIGSMPGPRYYHMCTFAAGRIYVWGGRTATGSKGQFIDSAYSAAVDAGPQLTQWREEPKLPLPLYSCTSGGLDDMLVSVGGRYVNAYPTNCIYMNRMSAGRAGEWTLVQTDLKARIYHAMAVEPNLGMVFISGGQNRTTPGAMATPPLLDVIQAFRLR